MTYSGSVHYRGGCLDALSELACWVSFDVWQRHQKTCFAPLELVPIRTTTAPSLPPQLRRLPVRPHRSIPHSPAAQSARRAQWRRKSKLECGRPRRARWQRISKPRRQWTSSGRYAAPDHETAVPANHLGEHCDVLAELHVESWEERRKGEEGSIARRGTKQLAWPGRAFLMGKARQGKARDPYMPSVYRAQ